MLNIEHFFDYPNIQYSTFNIQSSTNSTTFAPAYGSRVAGLKGKPV